MANPIRNPALILPGDLTLFPRPTDRRTYQALTSLSVDMGRLGTFFGASGAVSGNVLVFDGSNWVPQSYVPGPFGIGASGTASQLLHLSPTRAQLGLVIQLPANPTAPAFDLRTAANQSLFTLDASGVLYAWRGLNVGDPGLTVSGSAQVVGATSLGNTTAAGLTANTLLVTGAAQVVGATALGNLTAAGAVLNSLAVTGTTNTNQLTAGATTVNSLAVTGTTNVNQLTAGATTANSMLVTGAAQVVGATTLGNAVAAGVTVSTLNVTGTSVLVGSTNLGNVTAAGLTVSTLTVTGTSVHTGATALGNVVAAGVTLNSLTVTGSTVHTGPTNTGPLVASDLTANSVTVTGSTRLGPLVAGNLTAGPTTVNSLTVTGTTSLVGPALANALTAVGVTTGTLLVTGAATHQGTTTLQGATNASGVVTASLVDGNNASALYPLVVEHLLAPGVSGSTQSVGIDWYSMDASGLRSRFAFVKAFLNSASPFGTALSFNTFSAGAATENLRLRNTQAWCPHDFQVDGISVVNSLTAGITTVNTLSVTGATVLGAGTTGAAAARFPTGVLLTTPTTGAMEATAQSLAYTPQTTRRYLPLVSDQLTASIALSGNVNVETALVTGTVAAQELAVGKVLKLRVIGRYTSAATNTLTLRTKIFGQTIHSIVTTAGTQTNAPIDLEFVVTVRTSGAAGTVWCFTAANFNNVLKSATSTATTTVDCGVAQPLTVSGQWSASNTGYTLSIDQAWLEMHG